MIDRVLPADPLRPRWSSASALVYIGGLVVLVATAALLGTLNDLHGDAALVGYAALATALALGLALLLEDRDRPVAAGVAVTVAVVLFGVFVGALLNLIGILDGDGDAYEPAAHILELAIVAAAVLALRRFRAPLLVLVVALTVLFTFLDVAEAFSWADAGALVAVAVGAVLAAAGVAVDRRGRDAYAFWLHLVGGVAFGGGVLDLVSGDAGWVLVGVLSLVYVAAAYWLGRSSYAVLGAIGILATTTYFTVDPVSFVMGFLPFGAEAADQTLDPWQVALSFVAAGALIGLLGLVGDRLAALRRR